jgi:hypothetical protein
LRAQFGQVVAKTGAGEGEKEGEADAAGVEKVEKSTKKTQ